MKKWYWLIVLLCTFVAACSQHEESGVDPLLRAKIDQLNKESFRTRYDDPWLGIALADSAMKLVEDSLLQYRDGYLRASNNHAYNLFMLADFEAAEQWLVDSIASDNSLVQAANYPIERLISQLLRARMEQRHCNIAESYRILYEIDHSRTLQQHRNNYLHDFALMEYYITSLTLNYHYRHGSLENVGLLLDKIEQERQKLRCDNAQDMALNYSMAHSYYKLCDSGGVSQPLYLQKSLSYCLDNLKILANVDRYSDYHFANILQMLAFQRSDGNITPATWQAVAEQETLIYQYITDHFSITFDTAIDLTGQLFDYATHIFWLLDDPYQKLGSVVAAAQYYLPIQAYDKACEGYARVMNAENLVNPVAPKFETMLFAGMIEARYSDNPDDLRRWFSREMEIQQYISQNEKADFLLQQELQETKRENKIFVILLSVILLTLVGLLISMVMLRRRTKQLRAEKIELENAKRQDIERIANVETCLSVMRHDISPFISYLQNKNLPDDLRNEVLSQLIRTFDNMKNWTNLSIPSGLQFQVSKVSVQVLFDEVKGNCVAPLHDTVSLLFTPTDIMVNADPHLVVILLRNLINNALQHTHEGSVTVAAQPYADDSRFVEITVQDTGCGMTDEELDNLFRADKKIQQHTSSPEGYGSGFGLILCRYIIKKHDDHTLRGCRLWAESHPHQGTTFHFLLQYSE